MTRAQREVLVRLVEREVREVKARVADGEREILAAVLRDASPVERGWAYGRTTRARGVLRRLEGVLEALAALDVAR